jgi:hypothetical protein
MAEGIAATTWTAGRRRDPGGAGGGYAEAGGVRPARPRQGGAGADPRGARDRAPQREAKAARKAEHERVQREIAARKAALITQGITPESRSERKRRLAREATERAARRSQVPKAVSDHRVAQTVAGPSFDRNINRRRSGQVHAASRIQEETQDCATARHWE